MKERHITTLKKNKEFGFVYRKGNSRATKYIVINVAKSRFGGVRAGFSVSKKIGNSVVRNKTRRRLKEAFREFLPDISGNYCIVFIARAGIENASFSSIIRDMKYLLKKQKLLLEQKQ